MNYNLAFVKDLTQNEILNKRLSEVKVLKRNDVNIACSWVITLPKTINIDSEEEREFFKESYKFLENEYGKENVISAYVHKDETTPHMHFCFVPVVLDKKKKIEKVSAKELITREHLKKFHSKLDSHLSNYFNRDIGILNGVTANGNKTLLELKNKSLEDEIEQKQKYLNYINYKISCLIDFYEKGKANNNLNKFYKKLLKDIPKKELLIGFANKDLGVIDDIGVMKSKEGYYFFDYKKDNKPTTKIPDKILKRIFEIEIENNTNLDCDYEQEF